MVCDIDFLLYFKHFCIFIHLNNHMAISLLLIPSVLPWHSYQTADGWIFSRYVNNGTNKDR